MFGRRTTALGSILVEDLPGNHHALNFAGAFADGAEFRVTVKFLDGIILDETVASEDLPRFVRDTYSDFAGVKFGHAGLFREARTLLIREPRRVVNKMARCFNLRGHVGKLELNGLKFADCFAELLALFGILHSRVVSALRHAKGQRSDRNTAAVEHLQ